MRRVLALLAALCVAFLAAGTPARAADDDARLLAAPESAADPELLRRAAEDALEKDPADARALRALLLAVGRLRDAALLDDAIERAKAAVEASTEGNAIRIAYGTAILRRARQDEPPSAERLKEAERWLAGAEHEGRPEERLDLAHARHLLGHAPEARRAYLGAITASGLSAHDEDVADRAVDGLRNLAGASDAELGRSLEGSHPAVLRARALLAEKRGDLEGAAALLVTRSNGREEAMLTPRTLALRARLRRGLARHSEALHDERAAVVAAGTVTKGGYFVLTAVETLWREKRPLDSFADCAALERDYDDLVKRAEGFPATQVAWLNNVAFRMREVVSTYTWRGEGRSQGIAEGAPKEVAALLARCTALYDGAVSLIPKDAADAPFERRWFYAGVLNDAGLMRHYFVDVRDLARAEALYLRAFELTDGAYMDTYFYNLQYLYGFELPGREEQWLRLAQRARTKILAESKDGGFEPDERKRDAAGRDAEALRRKLEERKK